eukprot:3043711-Rhodomonas_salina.1
MGADVGRQELERRLASRQLEDHHHRTRHRAKWGRGDAIRAAFWQHGSADSDGRACDWVSPSRSRAGGGRQEAHGSRMAEAGGMERVEEKRMRRVDKRGMRKGSEFRTRA